MHRYFLICLLSILSIAISATGQPVLSDDEMPGNELVVATRHAPPFAIRNQNGTWDGISIDLWRRIAAELGLRYRFEEAGLEEMLEGVATKRFDAAVAALSVTSDRETRMDFTHPFHTSGIGIATTTQRGMLGMLFSLVSWPLVQSLGALFLVLFVTGAIVWILERRSNADHFHEGGWRGLFDGFYWSATTMTTVGYGDKAPRTIAGKIVAMLWMFAGVMLISTFTAAIASSLTTLQFQAEVSDASDLVRVPVATVRGSTADGYLVSLGARKRQYCEEIAGCMEQLSGGAVQAVVYDAPVMRYLIGQLGNESLYVLPERLKTEDYAFALPNESPLREPVNRLLLRVTRDPSWRETLGRYVR